MIRSALISLIVAATGATAQPRSEVGGTFTLPGIPGELRWLNDPLDWSASGGTLVITAGKETDLFLDPRGEYAVESSPRALFTPDDHFLLSSRTEVVFASTYDAGVLVVQGRRDQWAKLCFERSPSGTPTIVSVVNKGVSTPLLRTTLHRPPVSRDLVHRDRPLAEIEQDGLRQIGLRGRRELHVMIADHQRPRGQPMIQTPLPQGLGAHALARPSPRHRRLTFGAFSLTTGGAGPEAGFEPGSIVLHPTCARRPV